MCTNDGVARLRNSKAPFDRLDSGAIDARDRPAAGPANDYTHFCPGPGSFARRPCLLRTLTGKLPRAGVQFDRCVGSWSANERTTGSAASVVRPFPTGYTYVYFDRSSSRVRSAKNTTMLAAFRPRSDFGSNRCRDSSSGRAHLLVHLR